MIITVSGPSSTGKTSLVERLKDYTSLLESISGRNIVFGQEGIKEIAETEYSGRSLQDIFQNKEESLKIQFRVAELNLRLYTDMLKHDENLYIYDRGTLDNLIYTILCYNACSQAVMTNHAEDFSRYCALNRSLAKFVDLVFLTKVDNLIDRPEEDGFRPELFTVLRKTETELFNTVFDIPGVIPLPSDSNERLVTFFDSLRRYINS